MANPHGSSSSSSLSLLSRSKAVNILPPLRNPGSANEFGSTGGGLGGAPAPSLSLSGSGGGGGGAYQPRPNLNLTDPNPFAPQQPAKNSGAHASSSSAAAAHGGGVGGSHGMAPRLSLTGGSDGSGANPFAPTQPSSSSSSSSSSSTGGNRRPNLNVTDPNPWAMPPPASASVSGGARHPQQLPSLAVAAPDDDHDHARGGGGRRPNLNLTDPNPFAPAPKERIAPSAAVAAAAAAGDHRGRPQPLNGRRALGAPAAAVEPTPAAVSAPAPAVAVPAAKLKLTETTTVAAVFVAPPDEPADPVPASGDGDDDGPIPVLTDDGLVLPGDGERASSIGKLSLSDAAALNPGAFSVQVQAPADDDRRRPGVSFSTSTKHGDGGGDGDGDDEGPLPVLTDDGLVDAETKAPVELGGGRRRGGDDGAAAVGGRGLKLPGARRLGDDGSAAAAADVPPPLFSPPSLPLTVPEPVVTPKSINLGADSDIPVLTDDGLVTKAGARIDLDEMPNRQAVHVPFGLKLAIPPPAQPYRNVLSNTDPRRASQIMSNKRASMMSQTGNKPGGMAGVFANLAAQHASNTAFNSGNHHHHLSTAGGGGGGGGAPPPMGGGLMAMKLKIDIKAEVNPNARKEGLAQEGNDGEWPEPPAEHEIGGAGAGGAAGGAHALAASLKSQGGGKDRYATFVVTKDNTFVSRGFKIDEHGVHMTPDRKAKELARKKNPLLINNAAGGAGTDDDLLLGDADLDTMSDTVGMEISHSDLIQITVLGRGQNGNVYKSLHMTTFTLVALKTVNAMERSTRHQLVKELSTFCQINNPHLVRLLGAYFHEGEIFMALECMNAGSLQQWVEHYGPMKETLLKSFCRQMVLGIRHLHLHMQLHNDIKPANVLLNKAGVVKLCDFGLAKQFDRNSDKCLQFLGTTVYLSPERITSQEFSYPSDIWSLGLTVLYCALGHLPWEKESDYWSLISQITKKSPTLSRTDGKYSAELCDFVDACLMQDPNQRATADQLLKHPFLIDQKTIAPIYQDTRAAMEELEEIMEVAVQKIMLEPKNFKELSGQLGLDEAVVKDCWNRHKAARDAEEAAREASEGKSRVRVQLSAGRRRNNFMEPETPTAATPGGAAAATPGGAAAAAAAPPTPARSELSVATGSTATTGNSPNTGHSSVGSGASSSSNSSGNNSSSSSSSSASSGASGGGAPPALGRPFSGAEPSSASTPLAPGGASAAARDRAVSAPSKPLERSLSARRRANFRVNAAGGGMAAAFGAGGEKGSPSPIITDADGDIRVLDTGDEPHSATAVSASAAAAARLGANAGPLGALRNTPSPPGPLNTSTGSTGSPAPGSGHGRSVSMFTGGNTPNSAHKHKFKPVQKLGLMSPRDALAAADRVQLVAPSPRFSTKVTTLPPAAGATGAATGTATPAAPMGSPVPPASTAVSAATVAANSIGIGGSMLSAAAAAAAAQSTSAQRAQERRREVGLARRRGGTDADQHTPNSRSGTGNAADIAAAVQQAGGGAGLVSPANSVSSSMASPASAGPSARLLTPASATSGGAGSTSAPSSTGGAPGKNPFMDLDPFTVNKQHRPSLNAGGGSYSPSVSPLPGGGSSGNAGSSPQPAAVAALSAAAQAAGVRQPTRPSVPKPGGAVSPAFGPTATLGVAGASTTGSAAKPAGAASNASANNPNNIFADPIFALAASGGGGAGAAAAAAPPAGTPGTAAVSLRTKKLLGSGAVRKNHRRSRSNPNLYDEALAATGASAAGNNSSAGAGAGNGQPDATH